MTDLANALRICRHHHHELLHCDGLGWLAWDGRRWAPDRRLADMLAHQLPGYILEEVSALSRLAADADEDKRPKLQEKVTRLAKWAASSANARRLHDALALAAVYLSVEAGALDSHPHLLNVATGTIDLRTSELRPHNREDRITKLCPIEFDPAAKAPRFEALVRWAMKDRDSLISYLQRAAGYSAVGTNREQALLFAYGSGANGKSTILGAIADTLGQDYAVEAAPDLLIASAGERHSTELAHLRGARMALCTETEAGRKLATVRMKMLTGEPRITARKMRQDYSTFNMEAALWLQSNHRPEVTEQTRAVWRRLRVIPFDATVEREDKALPEKLREERPGILCWIIEGAADWYRDGLGMPPEVEAAVEEYRAESDALGSFLADCCAIGDFSEPAAGLYDAYKSHATSEGAGTLTRKQFKVEMVARGYGHKRTKRGVCYEGLTLTDGEGAPDA